MSSANDAQHRLSKAAPRRPERRSRSLELVRACGLRPADPIIDVSGAARSIVEPLFEAGYMDVTVLDPSPVALAGLLEKLDGLNSTRLTLLGQDVTRFHPQRRYALWCDEGLFHFFHHPEERQQYVEALEEALCPGGQLVIATFGPEGPEEEGGAPVRRYSAATLQQELGSRFELTEHSIAMRPSATGSPHQFLHARFIRHAPAHLGRH